ncbi:MAG: hypothetical protein MZV63_27840 [Marinilabiliales bacterium]|nr:hypothetical protein [Marinilabiliales bacterium]
MPSTTTARRWRKTNGPSAMMRRNCSNWRCTTDSTAIINQGAARTRFLKEVEDKKAEMNQGGPVKISKKQFLPALEDGTVLIYSGATYTSLA